MSGQFRENIKRLYAKNNAPQASDPEDIVNVGDIGSVSSSVVYGSFTPDNTPVRVIQTGLSTPIKYIKLVFVGGNFTVEKTSAMAGTLTIVQRLQDPSIVITQPDLNGLSFVNDGKDFEIKNDDDLALNGWTASTVYWMATS